MDGVVDASWQLSKREAQGVTITVQCREETVGAVFVTVKESTLISLNALLDPKTMVPFAPDIFHLRLQVNAISELQGPFPCSIKEPDQLS